MTEAPKYTKTEIERRWIVRLERAESLSPSRTRRIEDKYIANTRLRPRKVLEDGAVPSFKLGKKYGHSGTNSEPVASLYLTETEHATLNELPGVTAVKTRLSIEAGSLDMYVLPKLAFAVFEVEFLSLADAAAYEPPAFVTTEVTGDEEFSGFKLASSGA